MIDVRLLRNDPDALRQALRKRDEKAEVERLISLDQEHRRLLTESERLKAERNATSKEIGRLIGGGKPEAAEGLKAEMRKVSERIKDLDEQGGALKETLDSLLLEVPNVPHPSVPAGGTSANQVVREWGEPPGFAFEPRPHWELGESLGVLDLARAAKISGSGFVGLVGEGAALSRALVTFMLTVSAVMLVWFRRNNWI